jgi:hypothetical protein
MRAGATGGACVGDVGETVGTYWSRLYVLLSNHERWTANGLNLYLGDLGELDRFILLIFFGMRELPQEMEMKCSGP